MVVEVALPVFGEPQPVSRFVLHLQCVGDLESGGAGQVVHDEVHEVLVVDPVVRLLAHLPLPHLVGAEDGALSVLVHPDIIGGIDDPLPPQNLTEVLGIISYNVLDQNLQ